MSPSILREGDQAIFLPAFGPAIAVVRPGILQGSGPATVQGKKICVEGDEKKVTVPGCPYLTSVYTIPGVGTLKIGALAPAQKAGKTRSGGKAVLLQGDSFTAELEVLTPAQQPPPGPGAPTPDPNPKYSGRGSFSTSNLVFKGS